MFSRTKLKLVTIMTLVMMLISVFFSLGIYAIARQESNYRYISQSRILEEYREEKNLAMLKKLKNSSERIRNNSNGHIARTLVTANLVILLFSIVLSYLLAKWSLRPIEEAYARLITFTDDASHELRSPLTAMRSEIEVAMMGGSLTKKETTKLLKSNLEEIDDMTMLVNNLLKSARYDVANQGHKRNYPIDNIIGRATKKLTSKSTKKNISISHKNSKALVHCDKVEIEEAIVIVLDNAINYSQDGAEVEIEINSVSNDWVVIKIHDSGKGISKKDLPHVFDRFYRASSSRTRDEAHGFGLGLSIAKNIVERNNGKIEIGSKLNKGTTVTISLPKSQSIDGEQNTNNVGQENQI